MIYFDNAATTRISRAVLQEMNHAFIELYANPSSSHKAGLQAKALVQKAREQCADAIGAHPEQILFTSGGTESNNLAVLGLARSLRKRQKTHLITTQVEHPSILAAMQFLEGEGFDVTYLPVTKSGSLPPALVESAFQENTGLVSIMAVNNETGNEYPVEEIAHLCHNRGVLFHTDFVQGFGQRGIDLKDIDFLSVSAHKFHGPKGIGFLYGKDWRLLSPLLWVAARKAVCVLGQKMFLVLWEWGWRPKQPLRPWKRIRKNSGTWRNLSYLPCIVKGSLFMSTGTPSTKVLRF